MCSSKKKTQTVYVPVSSTEKAQVTMPGVISPIEANKEAKEAAEYERKRQRGKYGRSATILTSAMGDIGEWATGKKNLKLGE